MIVLFFFSSRRRHTRFDCDWSSDVCSSDLSSDANRSDVYVRPNRNCDPRIGEHKGFYQRNFRSEERRVGKSVDLGGRRIIKKKKEIIIKNYDNKINNNLLFKRRTN